MSDLAPPTAKRIPDADRMGRLDMQALFSTVAAATAITNQVKAVLRESGVRLLANDMDALVFLVSAGPMRPVELLRHTVLTESPATLHAILARLEERGFVSRAPYPDDQRGLLYSATPAGEAVIESISSSIERQVIHRFAGHFSAEELVQLVDLTRRI